MTTEFRLIFTGQTEANTLGWINEYRSHPQDATRLVLPAAEFLPQMMAQYPGNVPPVDPPQPPQPGGTCIGDLTFDGRRWDGMDAGAPPAYVYARFLIPAGFDGKTAQISFSEHGSTNRFRTVVFSQTAGDFATPFPGLQLGTSGHIGVAFAAPVTNCVTVQAGQTWFLSIRNTYDDGRPTAGPPFGIQITAGVPG